MSLLIVFAVVVIAIAVGSWIYFIKETIKESEEGFEDTMVLNSMKQYTKSKSGWGKLKKIYDKDGWCAVEFYPRDQNLKRLEKENISIQPEVIFVPKNNINRISKGELLCDYGVLEIVPIRGDDISNGLKNSCVGMGLQFASVTGENDRFKVRIENERAKNIELIGMDVKGLGAIKQREKILTEGIVKPDEKGKPPVWIKQQFT